MATFFVSGLPITVQNSTEFGPIETPGITVAESVDCDDGITDLAGAVTDSNSKDSPFTVTLETLVLCLLLQFTSQV